ncbi:hypothetical protein TruAng_004205 [Truncatella angustata]|nr:hypothetical protein TruAng_004205 [Truncatella angustata]
MEFDTLCLIHKKTTVPVLRTRAWGVATSDPLALGPFSILDVIEGWAKTGSDFDNNSTQYSPRTTPEPKDEEKKMPPRHQRLSGLLKWSQRSGTVWLHMVLSSDFKFDEIIPFTRLREHNGYDEEKQQGKKFCNTSDIESFVTREVVQLKQDDEDYDNSQEDLIKVNCRGNDLRQTERDRLCLSPHFDTILCNCNELNPQFPCAVHLHFDDFKHLRRCFDRN